MMNVNTMAELIALHKTIMEAKFHAPPINEEVISSPILAKIAHETLEGIIAMELREGREPQAESWRRWRDVEGRPEVVRLVIECARQSPHWAKMTREEKQDYIQCALSPVVAAPDTVARLVEEVDSPV